ncbi:hypothetical protein, partial [Pseudomonas jessenii]|uniref:hypothetical protein n=1 Tax=Pseudomonas jessenii TaxID=77298 RepID=UPI0019D4970A
ASILKDYSLAHRNVTSPDAYDISRGEEARVKALTIFKDHAVCPETREELPPIEGLSLEKFSNLVLRWSKYSSYLLRTERIALNK